MRRPGPSLVEGPGPSPVEGPGPSLGLAVVLCMTATALFGCARPAPTISPALDPLQRLRQDISATTTLPGVQRAAWGIVVESLDRQERVFELNPRTLLVPASA